MRGAKPKKSLQGYGTVNDFRFSVSSQSIGAVLVEQEDERALPAKT